LNKIDYSVKKTNLYEQVADSLEQAIIRSGPATGKLPSEQELSARFAVSRTVVREALKVLKERGLIQPRNGEGSYISKPNMETVSTAVDRLVRMDNISNKDIHGMRIILESSAARLAAVHAKPEDIDAIAQTIEEMSHRPLPAEKRIQLDSRFHVLVARAGGNKLLEMFVEVMTTLLREYMIKGFPSPSHLKSVVKFHGRILESIKERNPDDAEEAMRAHLTSAREKVDEYEKKLEKTARRARSGDIS
jgi:GntR family transcriptional repressor for pyruvate dehydrogenase complex